MRQSIFVQYYIIPPPHGAGRKLYYSTDPLTSQSPCPFVRDMSQPSYADSIPHREFELVELSIGVGVTCCLESVAHTKVVGIYLSYMVIKVWS